MKILAIRGSNLASLGGEFFVDFTAAPLADAGVFAISGPTGAGKSTLLDALCLALYHDTPRLAAVNEKSVNVPDVGQETLTPQDVRTLLRRGAAQGHAEVDFIGVDGRRWRAHWAVQRARRKPQGKLQNATARLEDLDAGQVIATQVKEVRESIEQRVGLSFAQFQRSVLLAQNDFAALLKARTGERAELLEALTDTAIFTRLSILAHERCREEDRAVDALRAELQYIDVLGEEQRAALEQELSTANVAAGETATVLKAVVLEDNWHKERQRAVARLSEAKAATTKLDSECEARREAFAELDTYLALRPLVSDHERIKKLAQSIAVQKEELKQHNDALPARCKLAEQAKANAHSAEQAFAAATKLREDAKPMLAKARELDTKLKVLIEQFKNEADAIKKAQTDLDKLSKQIAGLTQDQEKAANELRRFPDEGLPSLDDKALSIEQERLQERQRSLDLAGQLIGQWAQLQQRRALTLKEQAAADTALRLARDHARQASEQLATCEKEREASRIALERANLAADAVTEQLRAALVPGEPCMVCGATEHPGGAHIATDAVLAELDRADKAAAQALRAAQTREKQSAVELRSRETAMGAVNQNLSQTQHDIEGVRASMVCQTPELDAVLSGTDESEAPAALQAWQTTAKQTLERDRQRAQAQLRVKKVSSELGQAQERHAQVKAELEPRKTKAGELETATRQARNERQATLAAENVDDHASSLDAAVNTALKARDAMQGRLSTSNDALKQLESQIAAVSQKIMADTGTLEDERANLTEKLKSLRLQLGECAPTPETLGERLSALPFDLDNRIKTRENLLNQWREAGAAQKAHQSTLVELDAQAGSKRDADTVTAALITAQQADKEANESQIKLRERLKQDDDRRTKSAQHQTAIQKREQAAQRWRTLANLIGSADGAKFRGYAQQFTLDVLLDYANQHLDRLAPRYQLLRGDENLSLLVVDRDFAEEVRSVHSLSGGESFLVSLALALGLASLSSEKVKVESLFIDEGFGSLDADTLNVAMEALERLQADGRRIGVISHVHDMAERIGVQVRVEPAGGGKSRVRVVA
ncbi:MAG: AAA family ATPase [Betaproteobacteria bacterium]|nr:AAA family ATPase [Betaproteobacteria bacterium]